MSNQEIFNLLSKLEAELYYRIDRHLDNNCGVSLMRLADIHACINAALISWHEATGCINE